MTVDVKLEVGGVEETITVTESPVAVQFNTASRDLTVEQKMVRELPSSTRNPFQLALLDPLTLNRGSTIETQPYHHRTANEMDIGGGTKYRNDVLLDGTPLTAGNKLGYTPPMDAVTEYTVQQNAVDAEFGHSAGGIALVTHEVGHERRPGDGLLLRPQPGPERRERPRAPRPQREPVLERGGDDRPADHEEQALPLRRLRQDREHPDHGQARTRCPPSSSGRATSRSRRNADGSLRVIYDPLTSRYAADGKTMIRDPFPGNKIPASRWDPLASQILGGLWMPNNAGDDLTGFNNFKYQEELKFHYYNFSTRLDWNINDRWKACGPRQPHEDRPGRHGLHERPAIP